MGKWWSNLIWAGLGAGAFYLYERSPAKVSFGREHRGRRGHLGGVYEALAWEQAGGPPGTSMAGGQANRKRKRKRSRSRRR